MKAMIFAAGYGSRLKPWTDEHPKALVPLGGTPMLGRVIEKLRRAGIGHIIVNTHHFAEQVQEYLDSKGYLDFVTVSHEPALLDTGGGLRKVLPLLGDEPVLIHNADIFTDFDPARMVRAHIMSGADATLLTQSRATSRFLVFDSDERMTGWTSSPSKCMPEALELPAGKHALAFGGVHIVSPSLYPELAKFAPADQAFSIIDFYKKQCEGFDIHSFRLPAEAHWFDVGKPETLEAAQQYISQ